VGFFAYHLQVDTSHKGKKMHTKKLQLLQGKCLLAAVVEKQKVEEEVVVGWLGWVLGFAA
jgi:hypothetical protein